MDEAKIIQVYNDGITAIIDLVKDMSFRIDSLNSTISGLNNQVIDLNNSSVKQEIRISELEAMLHKNSSNSSKPPSSDTYNKMPKNSRKKSNRPSGGQLGHKGRTLEKKQDPDEVIEYKNPVTCDCGSSLENVSSVKRTRQVYDIPKPRIVVTEHVTYETLCPICGKIHSTEFPPEVTQPTQYGENIQALMNYLTQYQLIPLERAVETIKDITGQFISEGTLVNSSKKLYNKLEAAANDIKQKIINSEVTHFDETGMRSQGKTKWLHVASTEALTYYQVHDKRGQEATQEIGILPNFEGAAVHDHWMPYYAYKQCTHSECNSHHIRYLQGVAENHNHYWAEEMIGLLIETNRKVKDLKLQGFNSMPNEEIQMWHNRYHAIIEKGIIEDAQKSPMLLNKRGKPKKSKPLQLLLRLQKYDIETLAFIYDFKIPFDNNLAERDIRMQKLRQKISGCFRGKNGANVFCRIRSYVSTAKKNGIGAMEAISTALKGQPFIPE